MQQKRILVTGGAGFIGSHLCEKILSENSQNFVYCLDNFYTGNHENIAHLIDHPNFQFIHHDVIQAFHLDAPVSQIYHLACPASPIHYQKDPIYTTKTSFLGALNALELARETDARILLASTSEIYGDPKVHPQTENYHGNVNCFGPRACYDEGKRISETLFYDYHQQHQVDIRIARIFNTYGPKMSPNDGRVVSNFITQAIQEKAITLYGEGSQTRSFCYVDDLVNGLILLMNAPNIHQAINLGNPVEKSIKNIAEIILNLTQSKATLSYRSLPIDDPLLRCPDITLANKLLNWQPQINLEDGLLKTIEYFKNILVKKS